MWHVAGVSPVLPSHYTYSTIHFIVADIFLFPLSQHLNFSTRDCGLPDCVMEAYYYTVCEAVGIAQESHDQLA